MTGSSRTYRRVEPTKTLALVSGSDAPLPTYDNALLAVAAAKTTDDVIKIKNVWEAMRAYARQASNRTMQIDAAEIVIRAERKLGLLIERQRKMYGLAKGGGDQRSDHRGVRRTGGPPTYADAGIKPHVAREANQLAVIPQEDFERDLARWRGKMAGADRVTKLICQAHGKKLSEIEEAVELAREKEEWTKRRAGGEVSRDELVADYELIEATHVDAEGDDATPKRWSERKFWEERLESNPCAPQGPETLNTLHKIVADGLTRLFAMANGRSLRHAARAEDYERIIFAMEQRIDQLYIALK